MPSPLVATKLFVPRVRAGALPRPRLTALLDRADDARLVLVSAPPGFGKTAAVAAWLDARRRRGRAGAVAWVSLEESERSAAAFWTYVITGLAATVPGLGAGVQPLLDSPRPPVETVLASVLNDLGGHADDVVLVLDDYHLADGPEIAGGMAFLLEHLPPDVHVVLCTRSDPGLPLARLRARGELVEVRAADLRFTTDEVAGYLGGTAGLDAAHVAALGSRTEGWVAALQLAALSLRGRPDAAAFVDGFAGDDRFVVDYLVEEVLSRQPDDVRSFLVRTSVLDRLSAPLCDAVTGTPGGRAMLETLERANLFVVPLDDRRRWYRYHHLFAEALRAHLVDESPGLVEELHRRASRWYDEAGEPAPAVRHALAGGDVGRAATLVELAVPSLQRLRQEATIRGWMRDLPDDVVDARPVLAVGFIGALMSGNEFEAVPARLDAVERLLASCPPGAVVGAWRPPGTVVADDAALARLPGAVQLYRAGLALVQGDVGRTQQHARLAADRSSPDDDLTRAGAAALSALASWSVGDLETAYGGYVACVEGLRRAGNTSDALGCTVAMADLRVTQGRLREASRLCDDALAGLDGAEVRGAADMHVAQGRIAAERGELDAALESLRRGRALGDGLGLPQNPYRERLLLARVRELQGDLAGALDLVEEAQRVHVADFTPAVRPVHAVRARLLAASGDVRGATAWAREHDVDADDELTSVREFEHVTLARVLLAEHAREGSTSALRRAVALLDRLLVAADAGGRDGSVLEVLVLQVMARSGLGDVPAARAALGRALELAEPEGHVAVFAVEGPAMTAHLREAARGTRSGHLARLVAAGSTGRPPAAAGAGGRRVLVAPLSARELVVLRLLASDLSGPQIARELVVSLNTVRTQTASIYAKLGVSNRRAAVREARDLDLLGQHGTG